MTTIRKLPKSVEVYHNDVIGVIVERLQVGRGSFYKLTVQGPMGDHVQATLTPEQFRRFVAACEEESPRRTNG
jgi:hypothetical protein